jgi:hypothetical protein
MKRRSYGAPHYAVFSSLPSLPSSLLGPNILFFNPFPYTLSLLGSSLSVSNQVSHAYKATIKIMILYNLIYKFLGVRQEDKTDSEPSISWI